MPALIESIKVAGLVLVMDTSEENASDQSTVRDYRVPEGCDGILKGNGVLRFNQSIDM